ncbi:GNAT family N-acetyltransferase [Pseudoflavitalea rhizosphaerae]|uniref:GNAT family N-acetyltransferase n=1 Tax=Pseudoflavitalea rhizosphaerae TaxID=1884793 RepID=UPI000F8EA7A0|nr:GNAT family N-acetyltransferase [Pseudoflavitalea rhizosphaerae]
MNFSIQPILENDTVKLLPLQPSDFEALYQTASDPKIWEQHPTPDRWKREVFSKFFEGAVESKGAFIIIDKKTGEYAGSTRFYGYDETDSSIRIGYTFYATKYWGTGFIPMVKKLMMDYIFQFADNLYLEVGASNIRSQIAVLRLGTKKIKEEMISYYGEEPKLNFIYGITKAEYQP